MTTKEALNVLVNNLDQARLQEASSSNFYWTKYEEVNEAIKVLENSLKEVESIRQALTPPTADEVCLAIMKHYESKIVFYNEMAKTFNEVHLTRNEEVVSNYANGEVGINYNALPPRLITMIGKFYESLEGEK